MPAPAPPLSLPGTHRLWLLAGLTVLGAAWLGPLPLLARDSFSAHMAMHVSVVAIAAPLLALGLAGTRHDPVSARPGLLPPVLLSALELLVVWSWHAPALHHWSQHYPPAMALEQSLFLLAALAVWLSALGGDPALRGARAAVGTAALFLTAMHMTLLGALLVLAPRLLYAHGTPADLTQLLDDQRRGGILMLLGGGTSYLLGALYLLRRLLRPAADARPEAR